LTIAERETIPIYWPRLAATIAKVSGEGSCGTGSALLLEGLAFEKWYRTYLARLLEVLQL
jgi:hypothetical protein